MAVQQPYTPFVSGLRVHHHNIVRFPPFQDLGGGASALKRGEGSWYALTHAAPQGANLFIR